MPCHPERNEVSQYINHFFEILRFAQTILSMKIRTVLREANDQMQVFVYFDTSS